MCNSRAEIPAFNGSVSDPNQGFALRGAHSTLSLSSQYLNEAGIASIMTDSRNANAPYRQYLQSYHKVYPNIEH
jgi:hypothetical protein